MRVGFIGLGSQGAPMARRIAAAGHPTTLWARRSETLVALSDTGAAVAESPAALAASDRLAAILSDGTANSFALSTIAPLGGSLEVLAAHADGLLRKDVGLSGDLATRAAAQRGPVVTAAEATLALMSALHRGARGTEQ
ncbi:NAD(P)-binding domain-containing protein [Nocardia sp. NPDC051750]|uniref:NAD(P)-binding domain-containing protein n=1 Tax=Nocardia sp. NPDC051750 TaxID=3364325 RepID=UPI0037B82684